MHIRSLLIVLTLVVVAGCSRDPVITITNNSSLTLSNAVVSGSGFSQSVGRIAAGEKHSFTVRPRGESGVRLAFEAGTNHVDSGAQGYFEAGGRYRVAIIVSTNLDVSVSSGLR